MNLLISDPIAPEGVAYLQTHLPEAHIDVRPDLTPHVLLAIIDQYHALIVRSQTQVTRALLARGARLKVVARVGSGTDTIDVEAARERGILVVSAPMGSVVAVAEHTLALLLALARHIPAAARSMQAGRWEKSRFVGNELAGKTLGLVGLGKIGMAVARRAQALGMRVIASDPYLAHEQAQTLDIGLLPLDDVLRQADVVSLHTPLTDETRDLLDARALALLKSTALLVNCARGGLVDEAALLAALEEGRIAGAALDVFRQEPVAADHPILARLLAHERVIATPHLGASTQEAQTRLALDVATQVVAVLRPLPVVPLPLPVGVQ